MKHVYKSFTLYPNELFSVQGNDTYYTYQNVGANSATIKGSNDALTWFTITSVAVGEITQQTHSYAFLKIEGDTEVRGTRGNSGTAVSSSNPLPVAPTASENHIGEVGGRTIRVAATFARPADTSAYAALDTVSTSTSAPVVITFSNMARINAGSGYITKARIMTDQKTNTARFRLHLFHTAPTLTNDNAAFPLLWADRANRVGKIDFGAMTSEDATNSTCAESLNESVRLSFTCEAANTALYGILETLDAFTPASGQNFYISLTAEQN